jgi:hypothetical protein
LFVNIALQFRMTPNDNCHVANKETCKMSLWLAAVIVRLAVALWHQ